MKKSWPTRSFVTPLLVARSAEDATPAVTTSSRSSLADPAEVVTASVAPSAADDGDITAGVTSMEECVIHEMVLKSVDEEVVADPKFRDTFVGSKVGRGRHTGGDDFIKVVLGRPC